MPILFFSGGIDSTTLAFDLAKHPYRYGVSVTDDTRLTLMHASRNLFTESTPKHKGLYELHSAIEAVATYAVELIFVEDPLVSAERKKPPSGGIQTLNPSLYRYSPDLAAIPYTPGWMAWMAAIASNSCFERTDQVYNPQQVFFAHQMNGPCWEAYDSGTYGNFDSTLEFYENLNTQAKLCSENVKYRVPFMENRMDKAMVVQLALELEVPLEKTSSCVEGWMKNCGQCVQCLARYATFNSLGIKL
jgi:hypothetical protein